MVATKKKKKNSSQITGTAIAPLQLTALIMAYMLNDHPPMALHFQTDTQLEKQKQQAFLKADILMCRSMKCTGVHKDV